MDDSQPTEKSPPEETSIEGSVPDYATRKIEPDELYAALQNDAPPASDAATVILTQAEGDSPAGVPEIVEAVTPAKSEAQIPVPPAASVQPKPTPPPATSKGNWTPMAVIIALAAVALACICSCTLLGIVALIMIPNM